MYFIFTLFIPRIESLGEVGSDFPYGLPNSGGDPRGSALAWASTRNKVYRRVGPKENVS